MRSSFPVGALVIALALLPARSAQAQADQQVNQLLQQAEQAFDQYLDIGSAQTYVDQAVGLVRQYGVTGNTAALAYAMRGVIHIWMGEESDAIEMFKSALTNNPNVSVPANWGGPDIDAAIEKARRQLPTVTPVACPVGTVLQPNGTCAVPAPTCPAGTVLQPNGTCAVPQPTCPAGTVLQPNGTCAVPQPTCPAGMTLQPNGTCGYPTVTCPAGTVLQPNGTCAAPYVPPTTCPAGMVLQPNGTCAPAAPTVPMTRHTPVTEQLWNHPVPIYIEVNPSLTVGAVLLFFKTPSDYDFQRMSMNRSGPGFYGEIPCTLLQPNAYDYYIMVLDPGGAVLAQEGSRERPFHISMLQVLSPGALYPTRPDGSTATMCVETECVPGLNCAADLACRSCGSDVECESGEVCIVGCCGTLAEGDGDGDGPSTPGEQVGFFFTLDAGVGFGLANGTAKEPKWYTDIAAPDRGLLYGPDDTYLPDFDGDGLPDVGHAGRQSVPIATGFALSGGVVRIGMGYFIIPELSISANFRLSFPFGEDFPWLVEGRLHYWFLSGPDHLFGAFAGGGAGLMTHAIAKVTFTQDSGTGQCPATGCDPSQKVYEPYYKVSGLGAIAFGATYMYMIHEMFGIGGELGMDVMIPEFAFNFDLSLHLMLEF
ncbi:MAG: hypothetical protein HY907_11235 [Deltaproteobacteria bacterium]|nr:hypothetical protein [Deltaproteobacteria bacterium]